MKMKNMAMIALTVLASTVFAAEIHDAAGAGDLAKVKALVEKDPGLIRALDGSGATALHYAAREGRKDVAAFLLEKGAVVDQRDATNRTPLWSCAGGSGSVEVPGLLLDQGADINASDGAFGPPLMTAAVRGARALVDYFLDRGAVLPAVSDPRIRILSTSAAKRGLVKLMNRLIAIKADVRAMDDAGNTLLHDAAAGGSPEIIGILLEAGLSAASANKIGWTPLHYGGAMASLESNVVAGRWTMPKPMSFVVLGRTDDVPFPSPDGRKIDFVSNRPLEKGGTGGKENIWVMEKKGAGWSEPRPLPPVINSMSLHWQVSVDLDGNLYFGAGYQEAGGFGLQDIYRSKYENGNFAEPENLGAAVNGPEFDHSPYIAPDGSYLIFSKSNPQARVNSLFISFLKKDGTWTRSRELNSLMGYHNRSMCPRVTPDGKYLFFLGIIANENMPFWINAGFIEELRRTELLPSAAEIIGSIMEKEGPAAAWTRFKELRSPAGEYGYVERDFNLLGYRFLQRNALPEAIAVFRMNIELFPESANTYDSLGEAYLAAGDKAAAKAHYELAVAKDPNSANAKAVLASFDSIFERTQSERKNAYRPGREAPLLPPRR